MTSPTASGTKVKVLYICGAGIPVRYTSGMTKLKLDAQWVSDIAPGDLPVVTAMTRPQQQKHVFPRDIRRSGVA